MIRTWFHVQWTAGFFSGQDSVRRGVIDWPYYYFFILISVGCGLLVQSISGKNLAWFKASFSLATKKEKRNPKRRRKCNYLVFCTVFSPQSQKPLRRNRDWCEPERQNEVTGKTLRREHFLWKTAPGIVPSKVWNICSCNGDRRQGCVNSCKRHARLTRIENFNSVPAMSLHLCGPVSLGPRPCVVTDHMVICSHYWIPFQKDCHRVWKCMNYSGVRHRWWTVAGP